MDHARVILLVSRSDDVHAHAVSAELRRCRAKHVFLDTAEVLATPIRATVGKLPLGARIGEIDLDEIRTVWLRRVAGARAPGAAHPAEAWAAREAQACLLSLAAALSDRRWVNPLAAALGTDSGSGKLAQMEVARSVGLAIPETLVTNSPDEARAFIEVCGERGCVYKPFASPHLDDKRVVFTRVVKTDDAYLPDVARAPCLFQELVPKRVDVRGVVIGDRVLAAEIYSQAHPDSSVDFRRRYALGETRYGVHVLPSEIEQKVLEVHRRLGLVFGAFDLIHTPDGRHVFLETNQAGQWLWIEEQTGLPIAATLADLLGQTS